MPTQTDRPRIMGGLARAGALTASREIARGDRVRLGGQFAGDPRPTSEADLHRAHNALDRLIREKPRVARA